MYWNVGYIGWSRFATLCQKFLAHQRCKGILGGLVVKDLRHCWRKSRLRYAETASEVVELERRHTRKTVLQLDTMRRIAFSWCIGSLKVESLATRIVPEAVSSGFRPGPAKVGRYSQSKGGKS